ncbi:hypothetical protein LZG04_40190 [Saccharothrix sp. S26]|uniref:hypothetical protein n=1 Tax=Saccharothrix sp. S26 TaxID=2907215 RepID=UPI001F2845BD|nr:hypothetical protein [Saccharothrix sp. S26]MCE7000997.1 hypothetical protein [Saccharothrix sp. S26]
MRSDGVPGLVIAGLGLLVLVVFGFVVPSARAGGFAVNGTVVALSLLVPAVLPVLVGMRKRQLTSGRGRR